MKNLVAFGTGFFTSGGTALAVIATIPTPTTVQWLIFVFASFAGGFAGMGGKAVNQAITAKNGNKEQP